MTTDTPHRLRRLAKPALFSAIIVLIFFVGLELVLTLFGVRPVTSSRDPLVGFSGNIPLFVETVNDAGTVMMQTAENKLEFFNEQSFPKQKAPNSYRIFCMGGSTTVGRPYRDSTSFCGWLRLFLQSVDPNRHWEVINAGGVSYASYRVARLMTELVQYEPDLFIIYSGQNEFLEQRSYGDLKQMPAWLLETESRLSRTRTYAAVHALVDGVMPDAFTPPARQGNLLGSEVDEILKHTRGPTSYHRDDTLKRQVVNHYRLNLERMVDIARGAGAATIFVNPIANLKDMSPFKSEHRSGMSEAALQQWQARYRQANSALKNGDYSKAVHLYREALNMDDRYAELHYRLGRAYFELGDYGAAQRAFQRAIEEDVAPLRILAEMRRVVAAVANQYDVPLIDYRDIITHAYRQEYDHTVFGKEYFLDHVHLTIKGYRLLGERLLDQLVAMGIATPTAPLSEATVARLTEQVYAQLDKNAQRVALMKLGRVLDWAGKFEEAYSLFSTSLKLFGPNAFTYSMMGKTAYRAGLNGLAIDNLRKSLELEPEVAWAQGLLGKLLKDTGETDAAIDHLRAALRLDNETPAVHEQLAILLASRGELEAAADHFEEALRLNPDDDATILNFTTLLVKAERYDEAMAWVTKIVNKDSRYQAQAHNTLGVLLANKGQYAQALSHFDRALELNPDLASAKNNRTQAEAAMGANGAVNHSE